MVPGSDLIISRTRDIELIKKLSNYPGIYEQIIDDGCPQNKEDWLPENDHHKYYLVPWINENNEWVPIGVIGYYRINHILYDAHIFILPPYQAKMTVEIAKKTKQWMFDNSPCQCIIAYVPANKPNVLKFALRAGMKTVGVLPKSFSYQRQIVDQIILSIGKDDHDNGQ
jgi:RimJ/RimL family protein N-acetyltransferase